jgi:MFS family permease
MSILQKNKLIWIYILSAAIYGTQGLESLPSLSLFAFLKEKLHLDPSTIMYLGSLTSLAWVIKPLWGFLIDNCLSAKKWIVLSLLGSLGICFYLGLSPIIPLGILIPLLMLANFNTALRDVANDGIMCVEGKKENKCSNIQSIQWIAITIASIIVGLFGGCIADRYSYQLGYLCLIPIYLIIVGIVLKYRITALKSKTIYPSTYFTPCKECLYYKSCSMPYFNENCPNFKNKNTLWQSILSYKELFINKQFLLGCLFLFVYKFAPGFGTPLSFIERDQFKWSFTFMSILGAIGSIISIIGAVIYYKISKKINVKKCLFWSVFIVGITNLCYLYFTPVSDIIYTCIFSFLGMFIFLNTMTWMAKSTLPGKEATSFALLCSINNLSGTLSTITGAWLFPLIGLKCIIIIASISAFYLF